MHIVAAGAKQSVTSLATPAPDGSERPGRRISFDVIANRDWSSSGVVVQAGDRIAIKASGTVTLNKATGQTSGPGGIDQPNAIRILPSAPFGALIAVIGSYNDDFIFVGNSVEFVAARTGLLFLSVNGDRNVTAYQGSYKATVEVRPRSSR
jgi:hypothetical protein